MHEHGGGGSVTGLLLPLLGLVAIGAYALLQARLASRSRGVAWPGWRSAAWGLGVLTALAAVVGPVADRAHLDFSGHMAAHLLLGMVAPLLLVLGAPVTLALRALPIEHARTVSRVLRSLPVRVVSAPEVAAVLNVGALWLLYATDLYAAMHRSIALAAFVHLHMLVAGLAFTAALCSPDPMPHRATFTRRTAVAVLALGAHDILAKWVYAHPPTGVPEAQAHSGGMLMYYGGDAVDVLILVIMWSQWYRHGARRRSVTAWSTDTWATVD